MPLAHAGTRSRVEPGCAVCSPFARRPAAMCDAGGEAAMHENDRLRDALRRAREDLVICRGEMEVSTQEEFVDEAIGRIDAALAEAHEHDWRVAFRRFYDDVSKAEKIDTNAGDSAVSVILWTYAELRSNAND